MSLSEDMREERVLFSSINLRTISLSLSLSALYNWMRVLTAGFVDTTERAGHFGKHRKDFSVTSDQEYERWADRFLGEPLAKEVLECFSSPCLKSLQRRQAAFA